MHDVDLVPIFVSIDCRRDTFEEINEYCESFHPSLIGLSGTENQVDKAAKSFRLYFSKGMTGKWRGMVDLDQLQREDRKSETIELILSRSSGKGSLFVLYNQFPPISALGI